jgi:hypothetical protein
MGVAKHASAIVHSLTTVRHLAQRKSKTDSSFRPTGVPVTKLSDWAAPLVDIWGLNGKNWFVCQPYPLSQFVIRTTHQLVPTVI